MVYYQCSLPSIRSAHSAAMLALCCQSMPLGDWISVVIRGAVGIGQVRIVKVEAVGVLVAEDVVGFGGLPFAHVVKAIVGVEGLAS